MLRIYEDGEYKGSIKDDVCICVHMSRSTEPSEYIIKARNGKFYLGIYPRMEGHRAYGEQISVERMNLLLDEAYCDYNAYENLIDKGISGEKLFDEMLLL